MATVVVMPKQGQSVESCIVVEWKKQIGDSVRQGDTLCDVETDKATMETPSPVSGTLLALLCQAGEDVPVMQPIAIIGAPGEDISALLPASAAAPSAALVESAAVTVTGLSVADVPAQAQALESPTPAPVSPRARHLAERKQIAAALLPGSGPGGRVIERDVQAAIANQPKLTPIARAMLAEGGYQAPTQGTGLGGRVTSKDLAPLAAATPSQAPAPTSAPTSAKTSPAQPAAMSSTTLSPAVLSPAAATDEITVVPVKGVRKLIAERMLASLQTTAQLTLHAAADARSLRVYRQRLKESPEALGLRAISINDLALLAVARTLPHYPGLNALFVENEIRQYKHVHLGFAVDTPRGLLVPVLKAADTLSLRQIAAESKRLASACQDSTAKPDELTGGTFTVTNLGAFGIESFTPVLNPPQVAILGIGAISLKAVETPQGVEHLPHLNLSLTINHQVVDGAPAARFLQTLAQSIAQIDLILAG